MVHTVLQHHLSTTVELRTTSPLPGYLLVRLCYTYSTRVVDCVRPQVKAARADVERAGEETKAQTALVRAKDKELDRQAKKVGAGVRYIRSRECDLGKATGFGSRHP